MRQLGPPRRTQYKIGSSREPPSQTRSHQTRIINLITLCCTRISGVGVEVGGFFGPSIHSCKRPKLGKKQGGLIYSGLLSEIINGSLEDARASVCTTLISRPAAPSSACIDFLSTIIIITSKHNMHTAQGGLVSTSQI